jgi:hypothetical protein
VEMMLYSHNRFIVKYCDRYCNRSIKYLLMSRKDRQTTIDTRGQRNTQRYSCSFICDVMNEQLYHWLCSIVDNFSTFEHRLSSVCLSFRLIRRYIIDRLSITIFDNKSVVRVEHHFLHRISIELQCCHCTPIVH